MKTNRFRSGSKESKLIARLAKLRKMSAELDREKALLTEVVKVHMRSTHWLTPRFEAFMATIKMDVIDIEKIKKAGLYKKFCRVRKYKRLDITARRKDR